MNKRKLFEVVQLLDWENYKGVRTMRYLLEVCDTLVAKYVLNSRIVVQKIFAGLLAYSLLISVTQAQVYSESIGDWEVAWQLDAFDDSLITVVVNSSEEAQACHPRHPSLCWNPGVQIVCFSEGQPRTDLFVSWSGVIEEQDDGEVPISVQVRIDNSQPFEIGMRASLYGTSIKERELFVNFVNGMMDGQQRIALRVQSLDASRSILTEVYSLEGFTDSLLLANELCGITGID